MQLIEYLNQTGIRKYEFAKMIGIPGPVFSLILHGKRSVNLKLALIIEDITGGKVGPRDLQNIGPKKKLRKLANTQKQLKVEFLENSASPNLQTATQWIQAQLPGIQ